MGDSKERRFYQPPGARTKTIHWPRLVTLPWANPLKVRVEPEVWPEKRLTNALGWVSYAGLTIQRRARLALDSLSPLVTPEEERYTTELREGTIKLGPIGLAGESWRMLPSAGIRLLANGLPQPGPFELQHGQVIEVVDDHQLGPAFGVALNDTAAPDFGLGPLWPAFRSGAFSYDETPEGWVAVLRPGAVRPFLDSAQLLQRVLLSPLERALKRLELHVASADETIDRDAFLERHRALAKLASFEVRLVTQKPVHPEVPATTTPVTPHALFPADGWRCVPLERQDGLWVLETEGTRLRFELRDDGLHERVEDGTVLEQSAPWHRRVRRYLQTRRPRPDRFLLLPGDSPFLAGRMLLPKGPLTIGAIEVFTDQLEEARDAAAPLLRGALGGEPSAIELLWEPFAHTAGGFARPVFEGDHLAGFFEQVTLRAWPGFELDLPTILAHPMLQRLRVLELRNVRPHQREVIEQAAKAFASIELRFQDG